MKMNKRGAAVAAGLGVAAVAAAAMPRGQHRKPVSRSAAEVLRTKAAAMAVGMPALMALNLSGIGLVFDFMSGNQISGAILDGAYDRNQRLADRAERLANRSK